MRVLITGSRGFIGSNLIRAFRKDGVDVREMDLLGHDTTRGDVNSERDCRRFCEGVDAIVHGAAIHHATQVRARPDEVMRVNVGGTDNLLSAADAAGVRRFVYLSTAKIYGDPARLPSKESDPADPLDAYATTKLAAEKHCLEWQSASGAELAILRPFSVYGVGQDLDTGYIGMLLMALQNGVEPEFPGDAGFVRDFVYIDDLVQLTRASVFKPLVGHTTLNVASGRTCTLGALGEAMSSLLGRPVKPRYRQPPEGTITRAAGDISAAAERFGYRPQVELRDGLKRAVDWALDGRPGLQVGMR